MESEIHHDAEGQLRLNILISSADLIDRHLVNCSKLWVLACDHTYNTNAEQLPLFMFGVVTVHGGHYCPIGVIITSHEDSKSQEFMFR